MNRFRSKYINIFELSVYMNIMYAFIPIIRCLPYIIKLGWKLLPVFLVLYCIIQVNDFNLFKQTVGIFLFTIFVSIIRFSANCNGTEEGLLTTIVSSVIYWLSMVQGLYAFKYLSTERAMQIIKKLVAILLISNITTILGNLMTSGATRSIMHANDQSVYYMWNIGSYGYIYGLACCIPFLIFITKNSSKLSKSVINKMIVMTTLLTSILCLIISEYMTAVAIGCIGLLAVGRLKSTKELIALIILIVAVLFLLEPFLLELLKIIVDYANSIGLESLYERLDGIYELLVHGVTYGDVYARFNLYSISWNHFLENPLFGLIGELGVFNQSGITAEQLINYGIGGNVSVGRHSDFVDLLGGGGFMGTLPAVYVICKYVKRYFNECKDSFARKCFFVGMMQYVIYGIFDHVFSNFEVGFSIFLFPVLAKIAFDNSYASNREEKHFYNE